MSKAKNYCCKTLKENATKFRWMVLETEEGNVFLMPHIQENKTRVNYCPYCGEHIRDIKIKESDF